MGIPSNFRQLIRLAGGSGFALLMVMGLFDLTGRGKRRVVITGMGPVSPVGTGKEEFVRGLEAGVSGVRRITLFDAANFPCRIAAEVPNWDPLLFMGRAKKKTLSRAGQFAHASYLLAREDSMIDQFPRRTDVIIGVGGIDFLALEGQLLQDGAGEVHGRKKIEKLTTFKTIISLPASHVALMAGVRGHIDTPVSACTSGVNAILRAAERIRFGMSDIAIAGGVDAPINRIILNSFSAMGMLSERNADPENAVRPWDEDGDRSVLGEGACLFVLEELGRAIRRNARIYCEVIGGFQSPESDNPFFSAESSGRLWAENLADTLALKKGSMNSLHINAHAPGDRKIDEIEARCFEIALGAALPSVSFNSIKGAVAGGKGATGGLQVATSALQLQGGRIFPTANCTNICPGYKKLNIQRGRGRASDHRFEVVNAKGVGGVNASLLLERVPA